MLKPTDKNSVIELRRVGTTMGASVSGIDLGKPLNDSQFAAILNALGEQKVLCFPGHPSGQPISPFQRGN